MSQRLAEEADAGEGRAAGGGAVTSRTVKQPNTIYAHVGKALGLGEKRDREWWYSAEEVEAIKAEFARRAAEKLAKKAAEQAERDARVAAHLAELEAREGRYCGTCARRHLPSVACVRVERERPPRAEKEPSRSFYTMPFIDDPKMFQAVKFAMHMRKKGTSTALAVYKAAKYYGVGQHDLAVWLGKIGARKAIKGNISRGYERGRCPGGRP